MGLQAVVYTQENNLEITISVSYTEATLAEILEDISQKSGVDFSYSPQEIPVDQAISYTKTAKTSLIIDEIFLLANVQYEIVGKYLVLHKKSEETAPEIQKPQRYTISGYITDEKTNEVLIGATLYNKNTGTGTLSNSYGFFSLSLEEGEYNLASSYLGYSLSEKTIQLNKNIVWNINLTPTPSILEEVIISSFDKEEFIFKSLAAQSKISPFEVKRQVAALGETDVLKSLDMLPGINFHNEGSSYFYVRGGNRDQNLILLDEAPLYNPSHLLGLFTPVIPEAVKTADIYKADFPVQYGGRLSSVIDIRTKDGNMEEFTGNATIGLISSRVNFEGPFKKKRSSYFLSFRRSQIGFFLKKLNPDIEDFFFTDFTGKSNIRLGQNDRLFLTLYRGRDILLVNNNNTKDGLQWDNSSLTMRWNHVFGPRLFSNTTFSTSHFDYYLHTDYDNKIYWNSQISSNTLKTEFTYYSRPELKTLYGINIGGYFFNPGNYNAPNLPYYLQVSKVNSGELILYAGNEHEISDALQINYGMRISSWSDVGEGFSIAYSADYEPTDTIIYAKGERYYSNSNVEPRISLSIKTGDFSSLKLSYNKMVQHINLINNSLSPFNTLDVWLPSGPNIKPQIARIVNLGYLQHLNKYSLELSSDIFYKKMDNQIGFIYHPETLLNPFIEGELRQGDGNAYGLELMIKKITGKVFGQVSYAYSRSFLQIDGLNENKIYPSRQDKPLELNISLGIQAKPRWEIQSALVFNSGLRVTTPTGFYYFQGKQVPVYTEINNQSLPNYKRFDISSTFKLNKKERKTQHYLNIAFYNFFGFRNMAFITFNKTITNENQIVVPVDIEKNTELTPTYRFIYSIVPSFNYSMRF
ncbi:MAG: TonB-dependent receptor [Bacteroidales bacterium]|nr:TonB-dependent receptor [Bacteroidales bacterium]MBN2819069.1 TonB-dependent receptor [Bacteroidales bacterium]